MTDKVTRREFVGGSMAVAVGGSLLGGMPLAAQEGPLPAVITTWEFGPKANATAWKILSEGGSSLDAVEKGINEIELDPENNHFSVGYGGLPNEDGEVTLDAVIMYGPKHAAGAVACLKRIKAPISVARKVMEKTRHTFLVGEDATRFAVKVGFKEEAAPVTDKAKAKWEEWKAAGRPNNFWNHDTVGMVAIDAKGDITAGCSTSGLGFKIAGRVGDTPIIGSGAYCDNDIGGAAATGDGDIIMRFCPAVVAVELMGAGKSPTEACAIALKRIEAKGYKAGAAIVALSRKGVFGAGKIGMNSFPHAVRNPNRDELLKVE